MKVDFSNYNRQDWLFLILKIVLIVTLLILPFHLGYSFKHYYHVFGFMILPFTIGLIPLLFDFKIGIWKYIVFFLGVTATVIWLGFSLFSKTYIGYMATDGFRVLDQSNPNFVFAVSEKDKEAIKGSSYIVFMNPMCEACQATVPKLQSLTGREQTAIVYVDVNSDFGAEYVKQFPDLDKVPTAYNRETGEMLRLGFHTDNGIEVLEENINKIANDTKY
jgi:hypothetical protein